MKEAPHQLLDTDTLAKSLWSRVGALTEVGSKTAALAFAELKLATSSAALAAGIAIVLLLMLLLLWCLVLVAGFLLLQQFGLGALPSVGLLSLGQVIVCTLLAWTLNRLLNQMRFDNTRRALREELRSAMPGNSSSNEST